MYELVKVWYYHCLHCGHHFKLPKATKFSLDKVKTKLFCERCGSDRLKTSTKDAYLKWRTK